MSSSPILSGAEIADDAFYLALVEEANRLWKLSPSYNPDRLPPDWIRIKAQDALRARIMELVRFKT